MMIEQLQNKLVEVTGKLDKRTQHCQISAVLSDRNECMLSGSVLDDSLLATLTADLSAQFPGMVFNTAGIKLLRNKTPQQLAVNTNLTGLYASHSFLSEMMSQLLAGMCVEQLQVEGSWVYVRQMDGYLGWMYRPYLTPISAPGTPTHLVCSPITPVRCDLDTHANLVSTVLSGTAVSIPFIQNSWGQLQLTTELDGWVQTADLRPLAELPQTESACRQQMVKDAYQFMGVPYLWGGGAALGIDCSGYAQLLHRLVGVTLPRDADMQFMAGTAVTDNFQPGDLFFFASEGGHRHITHVGMSLGGWRMIHSSRGRNGVYVDDIQTVPHLKNTFVGARTFLSARV